MSKKTHTPKKRKWRFQFPNRGKAKQYFTGEGDTPKQGWQSAKRKMIAAFGHSVVAHAHQPIHWEEITEEENVPYKNLAHTIRDMYQQVLTEDIILHLRKKGFADVAKQGSGISTIHPEAVRQELEDLFKKKKISSIPPVYPIRRREAASELEESEMDFYENDMDAYYLEERRKGPTKTFTREKQRVGAKRAQAQKSTKPHRLVKRKDGTMTFMETVATAQLADKVVTRTIRNDKDGTSQTIATTRSPRRKIIDLDGPDSIPPALKKIKWRMWDGSYFGN